MTFPRAVERLVVIATYRAPAVSSGPRGASLIGIHREAPSVGVLGRVFLDPLDRVLDASGEVSPFVPREVFGAVCGSEMNAVAPHLNDQVTRDPSGLGRRGGALADILLADAVELAEHHWKVFPLRGKVPAIRRAHAPTPYLLRSACIESLTAYPNPLRDCKGGCGRLGHDLHDATDDTETVIQWWSGPYREPTSAGTSPSRC